MCDLLERAYAFNLDYARQLVADLDPQQMTHVPGPGHENHPTFTLGHLCTGAALAAAWLGVPRDLPEGWDVLFERRGPSDRRLPDDGAEWPSKEALLAELARQHARVIAALRAAPPAKLAKLAEWRLDAWMPRMLDGLGFLLVGHEMMHLGQLAAWRRAMQLPAAMAQMGRRPT